MKLSKLFQPPWWKRFLQLAVAILIPLSAGFIGSLFTMSSVNTWYAELVKPALNPPSWVFGPVWTALYVLMGVALFLVWREYHHSTLSKVVGLSTKRKRQIKFGFGVFGLQIILNATWSVIFFGLQSPGWALVNIILLLAVIVWTMVIFYKISKLAMYLLVPYILWVGFATYLNYAIWMLN